MRIDPITYGPWPGAWRLSRGDQQLVVVSEFGPRIMAFQGPDGENVLYTDEAGAIRRGDWKFYGGSRFWIAPETEASYYPEDAPSTVSCGPDRLTVAAPVEPSGLQRSFTIRPAARHAGFTIDYVLTNSSEMLARGAVWILTCVRTPGRVLCPWTEGGDAWSKQMIRFWRKWSRFGSDVSSAQWRLGNGLLTIEPTGEVGKVGLFSEVGLQVMERPRGTFIKQALPQPGSAYPDGGCNMEICTTPDFIELETLSPEMLRTPGQAITHREEWLCVAGSSLPRSWQDYARLVGIVAPAEATP